MDFTWDPRKNAANAAKHGIAFRDAIPVFEQPTLQRVDDRHDYRERRIIALGIVDGIEIVVVFTDRDQQRRIISARRASHRERQIYHHHSKP